MTENVIDRVENEQWIIFQVWVTINMCIISNTFTYYRNQNDWNNAF